MLLSLLGADKVIPESRADGKFGNLEFMGEGVPWFFLFFFFKGDKAEAGARGHR